MDSLALREDIDEVRSIPPPMRNRPAASSIASEVNIFRKLRDRAVKTSAIPPLTRLRTPTPIRFARQDTLMTLKPILRRSTLYKCISCADDQVENQKARELSP